MKFNFDDASEPPNLQDFKLKQIESVIKSAFWQNEKPQDINMLKVPIIMAPAMLRKQINNDNMKDSLLDKSIKHSPETFRQFVQLIDNKGIHFIKTLGL